MAVKIRIFKMLKGNLTCTIVGKLLTHYVEDNLEKKCKEMVSIHLRNCPLCMEKYTVVKKLFNEAERKRKLIKEREIMYEEISLYLDGEMDKTRIDDFESILLKRKEYEEALLNISKLKRVLNNSFYKTKYTINTDIAGKVIERLKTNGFKNLIKRFFTCFLR